MRFNSFINSDQSSVQLASGLVGSRSSFDVIWAVFFSSCTGSAACLGGSHFQPGFSLMRAKLASQQLHANKFPQHKKKN